jgi:hypothetical protein
MQPARTWGAAGAKPAADCRGVASCNLQEPVLWSSGELVLLLTAEGLHPATCKYLWSSGDGELLPTKNLCTIGRRDFRRFYLMAFVIDKYIDRSYRCKEA